MERATVAAQPLSHTFRTMKRPAQLGELRTRTWRLAVYQGNEADSPVWKQRAEDYWQRQMALYGYVVGNFALLADVDPEAGPVITTAATVLAIIPGERVDGYQLPDKAN